MNATKSAFPDRFFEGPAISFEQQPDLETLFKYFIDPRKTFTFVVGAGVSLDANLPTWTRLIENITELIPVDRWRKASKEDHSELLRKAESSLQLAQEDSPNLVSPLWEARTESPRGSDLKEPFLFSVAAPDSQARDVYASRAYAIKKAQYLSENLGLRTIFFKSYGQQIQAIAEASLAIWHGDRYITDENPATSSRYGHRLKRCLDFCYGNIGCSAAQDIPADEHSRLLSDRLHMLLNSEDRNGSIKRIFQRVRDRLRYSNDTDLRHDFESGVQYFDNENFGLFLWLRATKAKNHPSAQYSLKCVGTSVYQHREPWSLDRVAEVVGNSRFTSARAAFYGSPEVENFVKADRWLLWHSVRAVPFSYYEMEAPADDPAHESPDKAMAAIDVGVITLNSTHNYLPHGESRWSKDNPRSLFTVMNDDEKKNVNDELARIALEVVSSPLLP
jgi:hypothetical protein